MDEKQSQQARAEQVFAELLEDVEETCDSYGVAIPQEHMQRLREVQLRTASVEIPRLLGGNAKETTWVGDDSPTKRKAMAQVLQGLSFAIYKDSGDVLIGLEGESKDDDSYRAGMRSELGHLLVHLRHEDVDSSVDEFYDLAFQTPLLPQVYKDLPDYLEGIVKLCLGV